MWECWTASTFILELFFHPTHSLLFFDWISSLSLRVSMSGKTHARSIVFYVLLIRESRLLFDWLQIRSMPSLRVYTQSKRKKKFASSSIPRLRFMCRRYPVNKSLQSDFFPSRLSTSRNLQARWDSSTSGKLNTKKSVDMDEHKNNLSWTLRWCSDTFEIGKLKIEIETKWNALNSHSQCLSRVAKILEVSH